MLQHYIRQWLVAFNDPATMLKIPQAPLRAKRNRASSIKCNWTLEEAHGPGLHENWSETGSAEDNRTFPVDVTGAEVPL